MYIYHQVIKRDFRDEVHTRKRGRALWWRSSVWRCRVATLERSTSPAWGCWWRNLAASPSCSRTTWKNHTSLRSSHHHIVIVIVVVDVVVVVFVVVVIIITIIIIFIIIIIIIITTIITIIISIINARNLLGTNDIKTIKQQILVGGQISPG